ncbi:MAG: sulfite exporter TauE/SafE family protein [Thiotrichales bacterium]|nr:MAG: sulfite exporter TauE/SafE family protein [Thiotrichales bacterium]
MQEPQGIIAAFILGLFSTVHCLGMCGGIIGALSLSLPEPVRQHRRRLLGFIASFNIGRVLSYSFAGMVVGYIGAEAAAYTDMSDGPSLLRYTGVVMMIAIGLYLAGWFPQLSRVERIGKPLWRILEPLGRKLVPVNSLPKALSYGLIWGWLPCGMVYFVLVWALTSASAVQGAMIMAAFGLGTLPSLLSAGLAASWLKRFTHSQLTRQIVGASVIVMALVALMMPMGHKGKGIHGHAGLKNSMTTGMEHRVDQHSPVN